MSKFFTILTAIFIAVAVSPVRAHGTVETASPANGSTLSSPPSEIRLKFSEPLEQAFTSIKLLGPTGQEIATQEKARIEAGKTVIQPLPALPPGAYKAQWMSAGHDGHHIHGELNFTVK